MQFLVSAQEMKDCDKRTIEYYHVPAVVLMEQAALALTEALLESGYDLGRTGIVCGMGNNGGDGLAAARLLYQRKVPVKVFLAGREERATEQTRQQLDIVRQYGIPVYGMEQTQDTDTVDAEEEMEFFSEMRRCTLLVDGLFGVGLSRDIKGIYAKIIQVMNQCPVPKVAIDIPSGIDAGTGQILGCCVQADLTVTFAFCKAGLALYPGADYAGQVLVKKIGITEESFAGSMPYLYTCSTEEVLGRLPHRFAYSNKGSFGKTVLVVGCKGMAGAAYLAAMAAYRMGCGMVRVITPEENREIIQMLLPEAVLTTYADSLTEDHYNRILEALEWGDVIGIGSGLGTESSSVKLIELVLQESKVPIVLDGDGLNIIARRPVLLRKVKAPVVITPHLGEMARLTGIPVKEIQHHLLQTAAEFAEEYGVCCVLKDARTVVAYEKEHAYLNLTGNNGMAVGGSGDILAGMICSLIAQGMRPGEAAVAGVHLHGVAGDRAAQRQGSRGMIARDILDSIPQVTNRDQ